MGRGKRMGIARKSGGERGDLLGGGRGGGRGVRKNREEKGKVEVEEIKRMHFRGNSFS